MSFALLAKNPLFGVDPDGRGIYIFGLEIYYYALFIVMGMLIAAALSMLLLKRRNMSADFVYLLFIVCIPTAIIGARLFYCLTDDTIGLAQFFKFREGGMSITGGVIGGVGAGLVVCLVKKVNFFRAADCIVINILIAQALGRWGNFFNAEVYGPTITNPALQWFPFAVPIKGGLSGLQALQNPEGAKWVCAFFFYEMLWNMLGWALLFWYAWFKKKKPNGILTCLYFIWYGTIRMIMEPFRAEEYILQVGGEQWSEVFAVLMVGLGIVGCLALMIYNFLKEGSFVGSKRGDPCGITTYMTPYKDDKPYFSKINMFGANYPPRPPKGERKKQKAEENTPEDEKDGGDQE